MATLNRRLITVAIASCLAFSLTACGGGGGSKSGGGTPVTVNPTNPGNGTGGTGGTGNNGGGSDTGGTGNNGGNPGGGTGPATPTYDPHRSHLDPTKASIAAAAGITGAGVRVGIVDSGADASNPALAGRLAWTKNYLPVESADPTKGDGYGHGTTIAELIGGKATANFAGGVALGSDLYIARVARDSDGQIQPQFLGAAYSDLLANGVRIINNSFAQTDAITGVDPNGYPKTYHDLFLPVIQGGALMVFAAGNDGHAQPAVEAGLPYLYSDLKSGWLAVVNVALDSSGKVTGLDPTSNACGVAASWCLAAPGTNYFEPVAGTAYKTGLADGTSGAAAVVSGAAALVDQKFPWMTADNLRQTLLGTATALGDSATYGYGMVNVEKALNGPAKLDFGVFIAAIPSGSYTFSNDMTGTTGALVKSGGGMLTLTGSNSYQGGTTVNGGTLIVNGSVINSVFVNNGATIGGSGTLNVGANQLISGGTVSTAYGALKINGDYSPLNSGTTAVQLGTPLQVSGKASLSNSSLTLIAPPVNYTVKTVEQVLTAGGGVSGTFSQTSYDPSLFYTGVLAYGSNDVSITLTRSNVASVALANLPSDATLRQSSQNVETALKQADTWASSGAAGHEEFLQSAATFLKAPNVAAAAVQLDSLSGQIHASSQAQAFEQASIVNRALSDRINAIGLAHDNGGVWFQATGASGDVAKDGYASGSYDAGGALIGADKRLGEDFVAGIALGRSRLTGDYSRDAGRVKTHENTFSLYGRYDLGEGYLAARVGQNRIHADVDRQAILGGEAEGIGSTRKDRLTSGYVESGLQLKNGNATWVPFAGVSYDRLKRGAINEAGAGGFGLTANEKTYGQTAGVLGLRYDYGFDWSGGKTTLQGYGLLQHVFTGAGLGFTAAFAGAPDATFRVNGIDSRQNNVWVGVGATTEVNERWSWFVNANGKQSGQGNHAAVLSAGARINF